MKTYSVEVEVTVVYRLSAEEDDTITGERAADILQQAYGVMSTIDPERAALSFVEVNQRRQCTEEGGFVPVAARITSPFTVKRP